MLDMYCVREQAESMNSLMGRKVHNRNMVAASNADNEDSCEDNSPGPEKAAPRCLNRLAFQFVELASVPLQYRCACKEKASWRKLRRQRLKKAEHVVRRWLTRLVYVQRMFVSGA